MDIKRKSIFDFLNENSNENTNPKKRGRETFEGNKINEENDVVYLVMFCHKIKHLIF